MQRVVPIAEHPVLLPNGVEQILQAVLSDSWKVSGCGLGQGALSCAVLLSEYARMFGEVTATVQVQELFDRGCNSVVSGKTGWLDFADLALVCHKLHDQGLVQIDPVHFFEDIDKLALSAITNPDGVAGFQNSELGAALYALRRFSAGATHLTGAIQKFTSGLLSGDDSVFNGIPGQRNQNLTTGLAAPLLFGAKIAEIGLVEKSGGHRGLTLLVESVLTDVNATSKTHLDPGFQTGDLGKGYALLRAGMCFQVGEWITSGLQVLIDCAYATLARGIGSLDMASGAAGAALAFHKVYQLSGYDIFQKASAQLRWLDLQAAVLVDARNIDRTYSFNYGLSGTGLSAMHWQKEQPEKLDELLWLF